MKAWMAVLEAGLVVLIAASAQAVTIHVPADQPTIQAGVDAASSGDTVLVACGTYYEHRIFIYQKPGLVLRSETGSPDCVTINAGRLGGVVLCSAVDRTTCLEGFTLTGAGPIGGWYCAGLVCLDHGSPTVRNCIIQDNLGEEGGLVCSSFSSPRLENCTIGYNRGPGVYCDWACHPELQSCTLGVDGASWSSGGAIYLNQACEADLNASIVAFCLGTSPFNCDVGSAYSLSCCDVYGNSGGDWIGCVAAQLGQNGNFSADPLFCGAPAAPFYLLGGSPCLGAPGCGQVGAWGAGCDMSTAVPHAGSALTRWGTLKRLMRNSP